MSRGGRYNYARLRLKFVAASVQHHAAESRRATPCKAHEKDWQLLPASTCSQVCGRGKSDFTSREEYPEEPAPTAMGKDRLQLRVLSRGKDANGNQPYIERNSPTAYK